MKTLWRVVPILFPLLAMAHPMGNFSVNHYAKIKPGSKAIEIDYVLDVAEIPTLQLQQAWGVTASTQRAQVEQKAQTQARAWVAKLDLRIDGKPVEAEVEKVSLTVADGAGGLPVYRIATQLRVASNGGKFSYEDGNFSERAGWREIVIAPQPGATLQQASQSNTDLSQALTAYPQDPTLAPPQDVRASLEWTGVPDVIAAAPRAAAPIVPIPQPAAPPIATAQVPVAKATPAPVASTPLQSNSLGNLSRSGFLSRTLGNRNAPIGFGLALSCMLVAFGIGALHAVEPGHGKTMVAAYLVGSHGTPKHAVLLGAMVTFTHTVSVFLLGFITLFLAQYIMPETLTKYLGVASGLSIVWIGALLLYRRWRTFSKASHAHGHGHEHAHLHTHDHGHHHHHAEAPVAKLAHKHSHDHPHDHSHDHGHGHSHDHAHPHTHDHQHAAAPVATAAHTHSHDHGHAHSHDHDHAHGLTHTHDGHTHSHVPTGDLTIGSLLALGASGGMVPCPAALVLLLSCISLGRPALGIILLLAFSLGLALVLMAIGLAVLGAKRLVPESRRPSASSPWMQILPVASAFVIFVVGVVMTGAALGIIPTIRFLG